jgi:iron complex transport system ATP-binding protein
VSRRRHLFLVTKHTPDHAIMLEGTVALLDRQGNLSIGCVNEIMKEDILKEVYRTNLKLVYVAEAERTACIAVLR